MTDNQKNYVREKIRLESERTNNELREYRPDVEPYQQEDDKPHILLSTRQVIILLVIIAVAFLIALFVY